VRSNQLSYRPEINHSGVRRNAAITPHGVICLERETKTAALPDVLVITTSSELNIASQLLFYGD
jgi:hypothetical protein